MLKRRVITYKSIKNGGDNASVLYILALFAIAGIGFTIYTFTSMIRNPNTNNLITFIVVTSLFGIPFGFFIGIKKIFYCLRKRYLISKGSVIIFIDEIIDKTDLGNSTEKNYQKQYQLTTKVYSGISNKNVLLTTLKEFNSVKIGDSCILCFTSLSKRPFSVYPCTMYELSDELKEKCVESLADVLKK